MNVRLATETEIQNLVELYNKELDIKMNSKQFRHMEICKKLNDIYYRKNQDYGDSFQKQFEKYGLLSSLIRLDDKLSRMERLIDKDALVNDESIVDTCMDLANYAIMTAMELQDETE